jgi:tRNA (cytosine38-C5)-methyltransferase
MWLASRYVSQFRPRNVSCHHHSSFSKKSSSTRHLLLSTLRSIGYATLELLLTPLQFGIPNSRLRYYLLAKRSPLSFTSVPDDFSDHVWRQIPGLDQDQSASMSIKEYLDDVGTSNPCVPDIVLEKWGRLFDIVLPSSRRTCCFTRGVFHRSP